MASGEARRLQARDPRPVAILDRQGRPRWHPIWQDNPRIAQPAQVAAGLDVQRHVNGAGARPYIEKMTADRFVFRPGWRATRGEIFLTAEERSFGEPGAGAVVVEPHLKPKASPNKSWPWRYWQALVAARPEIDWVQLGPRGTRTLDGIRLVETACFRRACAVLARAKAAVLPEGGLHHAAAALAVPAVVIYGAFTSPRITGYDGQASLYRPHDKGGEPCGMRLPCHACTEAMVGITVEDVLEELEARL